MPITRTITTAALVAAVTAGVAFAAGRDEAAEPAAAPAPAAAPGPAVVRVDAGEWFFRAPTQLRAGTTTLRFRNVGRHTHQLAVARLGRGVSVEQAIAAGGAGGTATPLGEVVARPGATGELLVRLRRGRHVLLCFEERKGRAHHELGQKATFMVR